MNGVVACAFHRAREWYMLVYAIKSSVRNDNMRLFVRALLFLGAGMLVAGCGSNPVTTWSAKFPSPDGKWVAIARTYQYSGPGNDYVDTRLSLHPAGGSREETVLDYLDIGTEMTVVWTTPSHLQVTLHKDEQIDLQVVKFSTITITLLTPGAGSGG